MVVNVLLLCGWYSSLVNVLRLLCGCYSSLVNVLRLLCG